MAAVARHTRSNARNMARRKAVRVFNDLAGEVGLKPVKLKATSFVVEALLKILDPRCRDSGRPERLRAAVSDYVASGGVLTTPLSLPAAAGAIAPSDKEQDADGDPPPPIQQHKLFEKGFQLNSKAFMLTFNSRSFTEDTWERFLGWVRDKQRSLGARRWAACLEESLAATALPGAPRVFHLHA